MLSRFFSLCVLVLVSGSTAMDWQAYNQYLNKVMAEGQVNWQRAQEATNRTALENIQTALAKLDGKSLGNASEQKAFWLNAYHVCVFSFLLAHAEKTNVMDIPGFRDQLRCRVAGSEASLIEMEAQRIRKFKDPRLLFALWWGTKGSPNLRSEAYLGSKLDEQLSQQVQSTLQRSDFVRVQGLEVMISDLLDWFRSDFETSGQSCELQSCQGLRTLLSQHLAEKIDWSKAVLMPQAFNWERD